MTKDLNYIKRQGESNDQHIPEALYICTRMISDTNEPLQL